MGQELLDRASLGQLVKRPKETVKKVLSNKKITINLFLFLLRANRAVWHSSVVSRLVNAAKVSNSSSIGELVSGACVIKFS